jgi:glycine/D-amino acid oxidase-like deaminating enzyme
LAKIVIIGGGVIGSSIAYHLGRRHFLIRSFANTKALGSAGRSSKPS